MNSIAGILLATDLGSRCDRATDRALRLAREGDGIAVAATVVEPAQVLAQQVPRHPLPPWHRVVPPAQRAERLLRREFADAARDWRIEIGEGRAGDHLAALLDALPADTLAVCGPVREGVLGPVVLGSTIDRLVRRERSAVLMVRARAHDDYRRVLVACDFSGPCRTAMLRARALLPEAAFTVLHGFEVPMLGLMDRAQDEAITQTAAQLREEGRAFLRDAGLDEAALRVEHGDPARLVQQYLDSLGADLVVLGTHGRGAMHELVVGSVARRILTTVDADALVVRG